MHFSLRRASLILAVTLTMTALSTSSGAAETPAGTVAKYGSRSLNLSQGWGTAQSCIVYPSGATECYGTNRAADESLVKKGLATAGSFGTTKTIATLAVPDCASGWLCLFEHSNGGGRRLIFRDETLQPLVNFGFQNAVSSYRNRQTDGEGYLAFWGDSARYTLLANAYVSYIGDNYNDKADAVHP